MANFYKYADNPTVYNGSNNQAFSNPNDFFAAGGAKDFSNVQTIKGSAPALLTPQAAVITPQSLQPAKPITLPQVTPDTTSANSMVSGIQKSVDNYNNLLTPTDAATKTAQASADTVTKRINDLIGLETGKGAEQITAEQTAGLPDLKKQLADINGQVTQRIANYNSAFNALENTPQQTAFTVGSKQQQLQRTEAADIGLLQARGLALQGNITAAQDTVNRAIDLKYSAYEAELTARGQQLTAIYSQLDKAQQKQAKAVELALADEKTKLADLKAKQKENLNTALVAGVNTKFVNQNGTFFSTADGTPFETPADFFKAAGVKSFEEAYQKGLVSDINNAKMQDINTIQQIIAKYPDAGVKVTDSLAIAKQKLKSSPTYKKDTYIAPRTGNYELTTDANGNSIIFNKDTGAVVNRESSQSTPSDSNATAVRDAFSAVGTRLTKDNRASAQQVLNQYLNRGDLEGAKQFIVSTSISALPAEQQNKAFGRLQAIDALDNIQSSLMEYKEAGGNTGFLKGSFEKITQKLGETTDPKLADIGNRIALSMIAYRNAVSGAAFTESEQKQYDSIFPSIKGNLELNLSKVNTLKDVFNLNQKSTLSTILGPRNYESIMNLNQNSQAPTTPPPAGEVWVKDKASGQIGSVPEKEYDPKLYDKLGFEQVGNTSVSKTMAAIGQYESGGNYKAIGPKTESGDQAYGKYQVMGGNIPSWTKEALGYSLTPQQFLNDAQAQDAVAEYKMGKLIALGHSLENVASIWFSGRPLAKAGNAKDITGTSVPKYAKNIRSIYNKLI